MSEKKRIRLQPRLPRIRRRKDPEDYEDHEHHEEGEHHEHEHEGKPKMQDKKLLLGIVAVIAVVIVVLIALWAYPPGPPGPAALSESDIIREMARLQGINEYPENVRINPYEYPKAFGTWNNRTLEEVYFCSDVCPDYGRVYLVYQGVDSGECAGIGGKEIRDLAWGGYIGCEPGMG